MNLSCIQAAPFAQLLLLYHAASLKVEFKTLVVRSDNSCKLASTLSTEECRVTATVEPRYNGLAYNVLCRTVAISFNWKAHRYNVLGYNVFSLRT
jgi:hypothetical protein